MNSLILSLLIFLPVIGSIVMLLVAKAKIEGRQNLYKIIALGTTGLQLLLSVFLYFNFDPSLDINSSPFTVQIDWISYFNITFPFPPDVIITDFSKDYYWGFLE